MDSRNSIESRRKIRRKLERRRVCRRIITHPFGSAKWIQAVQESYLLWPKEDRRNRERRSVSRRLTERRVAIHTSRRWSARQRALNNTIRQPILTAEEITMLRELSRRL